MELLLIKVSNVIELGRFKNYYETYVQFECDTNCWNLKKHEKILLTLKQYEEMLKNGYFYG